MVVLSPCAKTQIQINSVTSTTSTCPNNGTITVDATSPSPPVLYSLAAGPVTQQVQTNPVFNSLPAGNYTVKISDGAGNEVLEAVAIGGNYQNPAFTAVPTAPYCLGESNGKLVMNITNDTGLAPFSWELLPPSPVTGIQNDNVFHDLPAGSYSVRVTDACGSVNTRAVTITSPNYPMSLAHGGVVKVGCDSMLFTLLLDTTDVKFPFTYSYQTSNGTYIPTEDPIISITHGGARITFKQIIPNMTYGDVITATFTNSCGVSVSSIPLQTYPFNFHPKYSYSGCGNSIVAATYDITPNNHNNHTYLKTPVTYTYTDLSTNTVVSSGDVNAITHAITINNGIAIPQNTYRLVITDGCGETFTKDYTIPLLEVLPSATGTGVNNHEACIDSVIGNYRLSTNGFGLGKRIVIKSGPLTLGSTKPDYAYSDTYTWPSDTIYSNGNFFFSDLTAGTYYYTIVDDCGTQLDSFFTIIPANVENLGRTTKIIKGCLGENQLNYTIIGGGTVTVKDLSNNTIIKDKKYTSNSDFYNSDSILNLPSGQYEITYDYYKRSNSYTFNDNPLSCWKIVDTITIPPYQNPAIYTNNSIMCGNQINIELIPDTTKGVPSYQYEIFSGPEISPLQNSNVFTVNTAGTYYARIFDKCGNATIKQVTIDTLSFEPMESATDCTSKKIIFPSSTYYTYEWILPNGQVYVGDSLSIHPVTPADTGTYEVYRITNINGCTDTVKMTYHIDLPNYSEQTISFCQGTTVVVGGNTYDTPGVYTDTLISVSGCDSLVVTTLTLLPQISDTIVVSICNGDSILISGNYYSASGFYTDSIQSMNGCYDLQVTELVVTEQFPTHKYVTLCNNDSYLFGNNIYTNSGIYYDTIQSSLGCDSIVVLHLDVLPGITHTIHATICEGDYYVFSGDILSTEGTYTDTLISVYSCDSIVTLYLNVLPIKYNSISVSICEGESFYFGGHTLVLAGIYKDTIQTNSCDSIVTLDLVILPHKYYQIYDTICEGADYVFGGLHYNHSGIYTHTFPTSSCDSTVTLNLTVIPAPSVLVTSVISDGDSESAVVQLNGVSTTYPLTYFWESSSVLSNNGIKNPTITIKDATWVTLTVTDKYGCTSTFEHRVELPITSTIYIPNAVTPDGNEFNNIFRVYGANISTFHILIFNRWGEIIFESHDFNFGWDATYKGAVVQDGVYTYKLSATGADGVQYNKTGHITVIK